jgi:hypothetical protein
MDQGLSVFSKIKILAYVLSLGSTHTHTHTHMVPLFIYIALDTLVWIHTIHLFI